MNLRFRLREATNWAPAGHVVATGQVQVKPGPSISKLLSHGPRHGLSPRLQVGLSTETLLAISSPATGNTWGFDLARGELTTWYRSSPGDRGAPYFNLLTEPLTFAIYRALTDNDAGGGARGGEWRARRMHQASTHVVSVSWEEQAARHGDGDVVEVVVRGRIAPPVLAWCVETTTTFRFTADSGVHIAVVAKPKGLLLPSTLARFGLTTALRGCERVRWFGRGPGESYRDKKLSQLVGSWEESVDGLFVDYEYPQEGGNRTDVRWVEFIGQEPSSSEKNGRLVRLLRARYGDLEGASFNALHYTAQDLDESKHPYELHKRKREDTVIHLDWVHQGLGTGSCGPATLPQYELNTDQELKYEIILD